jgi:hypothetical protein
LYKKFNKKLFLLKKNFLNNNLNNYCIKNNNNNCNNNLKLNFFFISLISPFLINNLRLNFNSSLNLLKKKIVIKHSYILLTWFYYISFIDQKKNNKNKIKFFIFPIKREKFTLTKAPMAHKNWSKEQYKFSFYKFIISFNCNLKIENNINNINSSLLFFLLTKKNFPFFETNLLFLKNFRIILQFKDFYFFNYFNFLNNKIK